MTDNHKSINDLIRKAIRGGTFTVVVSPNPTTQNAQGSVIPPGNAGTGTEAQRPTESTSAKMSRLIRKIAGRQ